MNIRRKTNVFERLLLIVGLAIGIIGFYLLDKAFKVNNSIFSVDILNVFFLWLILVFVMILSAISENQREELCIIASQNMKEVRYLKEINQEMVEEIKLMRKSFEKKK